MMDNRQAQECRCQAADLIDRLRGSRQVGQLQILAIQLERAIKLTKPRDFEQQVRRKQQDEWREKAVA